MSRSLRLLFVGIVLLAGSAGVIACSCAPPPPPAQAMQIAAGVFLGKVTNIVENQASFTKTVTISVERWWKGGDAATATVTTAMQSATCGFNFKMGDRYLVYADGRQPGQPWNVSLCSRTAGAAAAANDLKVLGAGIAPKKS